jgi:hypothetical protein
MKQVTLNIKEKKYEFFMELLKNLDFVQVKEIEGDSKEEIRANLERAFKDLKLYKEGKLKTSPAKNFLNEL